MTAFIENAPINAGGDVTVEANNAASLSAELTNDARSASEGGGVAVSGVIGMNKVRSSADAHIDFADGTQGAVNAGGAVSVLSADASSLTSTANFSAVAGLAPAHFPGGFASTCHQRGRPDR